MAPKFQFDDPESAIRALGDRLACAGVETKRDSFTGRVLAQDVLADRNSPAADVSAMDGYAIRIRDLDDSGPVSVHGESAPGAAPPEMPADGVVRIFTGAIVPAGCEAVVKREDTEELDQAIRFRQSARSTQQGDNIRRSGENAQAGDVVLSSGTVITAALQATMANFGCLQVDVHAPVRVSIITTGDEVGVFKDTSPKPWQLRNSNRVALAAMLETTAWAEVVAIDHCKDDRVSLTEMIRQRLDASDAILLTGGVSMGDYDYVPDVVRDVGGQVVFHGLPIRPGKPILGAATQAGKLIVGLPGNPVSATVGCRRMAMPLLAKIGGQSDWLRPHPIVQLANADSKTIPLHWMRLVRLTNSGRAELVQSQGSGDLVSLGQSTGFVELPPSASGPGPWPYYCW